MIRALDIWVTNNSAPNKDVLPFVIDDLDFNEYVKSSTLLFY
jgi:hypothetical protein